MSKGPIRLGDRARYKVNGFTGIVTGITDYLQQCRHVYLAPEGLDKEGKVQEGHWYDEPWCEVVKASVFEPQGAAEIVSGGRKRVVSGAPDRPHPPARH